MPATKKIRNVDEDVEAIAAIKLSNVIEFLLKPLDIKEISSIRKVGECDLHCYLDHINRLDRHDVYMRFSGYMSQARIENYIRCLDMANTTIFGLSVSGEIRGAVEIHVRHNERIAEFAFSVEKTYQGRGFGSMLMEAAISFARGKDIALAEVICSPENERMKRLAKRFTNRIEEIDDDMLINIDISGLEDAMIEIPSIYAQTSQQHEAILGGYI